MGRAVFADADRVVREDVDDRDFHEGRKANRSPREVGEDEEARPEGPELRKRESVRDGRGGVLADAEVEVAPGTAVRLEVARPLERQPGLRRWREIGCAPEQPRHVLRDRVQDLARRVAARDALRVRWELGDGGVPALGQLAALHALYFVRQLGVSGLVLLEQRLPGLASLPATRPDPFGEVLVHPVRNQELRVLGPTEEAL